MSLAVEETDPLAVFAVDVTTAHPAELRRVIRRNAYRGPTGGMAHGFTHGNLAIIPESYALDFARFCQRNPRPCPIVGVSDTGDPRIPTLGADLDIRTDIPSYNIYRDGVLESSVPDIMEHWRDDMVAFVIGCSYSFEEALVQGGVPLRHLETGEVPPMWKTSIPLAEAGPFGGGMVVSMRPMTPANAIKASAITARFPHTHGMPVHFGDPAAIGIADIAKPDWGDVMVPREGEVPVFWACGVTPQNAIREAGIPMVVTHTPAHMLITDVPSAVS